MCCAGHKRGQGPYLLAALVGFELRGNLRPLFGAVHFHQLCQTQVLLHASEASISWHASAGHRRCNSHEERTVIMHTSWPHVIPKGILGSSQRGWDKKKRLLWLYSGARYVQGLIEGLE